MGASVLRSTKAHSVTPCARTSPPSSRITSYRRSELTFFMVATQVRTVILFPSKAGLRYSMWWERTTQAIFSFSYRSKGQPWAAEWATAASTIHWR